MLKLTNIISELGNVSASAAANHDRTVRQMDLAIQIATQLPDRWAAFVPTVNASQSRLLTARLLSNLPIGTALDPPPAPEDYSALAVDGSQIPLDRHSALPYYLINVGHVVIHYGAERRPRLAAEPTLFYTENDILSRGDDGELSYRTESEIGAKRGAMEIEKMTSLLPELSDRTAIALLDGPLVLWVQDPQNNQRRKLPDVDLLCTMLAAADIYNVAVAGYISRPGSRDVINAIRSALTSAGAGDPQLDIDRITDAQLFAALLEDGQRSAVFESRALILSKYTVPNNRVGFFYFNTGREIARVEMPLAGTEIEDLAGHIHSLVLDQVRKGAGYPVSLMEAHELAVVRSADRAAVDRLVQNELLRRQIPVLVTRKSLSKRMRPI